MTANEKDFPVPQYPSKENGYNRGLGSPSDKLRDAGFNNGDQVPAYGNELTARQLIDKLQSANESLKAALKELVELKDMKEKLESVEYSGVNFTEWTDEHSQLEQDYNIREPLAWEAARKLLK